MRIPPSTFTPPAQPRFSARYKAQTPVLGKGQMMAIGATTMASGFLIKGLGYLVFVAHPIIGSSVLIGGLMTKAAGLGMLIKSRLMGSKQKKPADTIVSEEKPKTFFQRMKQGVSNFAAKTGKIISHSTYYLHDITKRFEEGVIYSMDYVGGSLYNVWWDRKNARAISAMHNKIQKIPVNSAEYIESIKPLTQYLMRDLEAEVNTESNRLHDIAKSDEACIFIINNEKVRRDPALLGLFTGLLYQESIAQGKAETCPRPKFIVNEKIVQTHHDKKVRDIYEFLGVVGINTRQYLRQSKQEQNTARMTEVMDTFNADKNHVFFFSRTNTRVPGEDRFQNGLSRLIVSASGHKPRVKVVPVGFARNSGSTNLGSIYIGAPVFFKLENGKLLSQKGGSPQTAEPPASDPAPDSLPWIPLHAADTQDQIPQVSTFLFNQLNQVCENAKQQLPTSPETDPLTLINPVGPTRSVEA